MASPRCVRAREERPYVRSPCHPVVTVVRTTTGGIVTTPVSTRREPELAGQTIVVIGGSAGIGLETARKARAEGASVILTGRNR